MTYFQRIGLRLMAAAEQTPIEVRQLAATFLRAQQRDDGGFAGRRGASNPYYTAFGLQGLAYCGALDESAALAADRWLHAQVNLPLAPIDQLALLAVAALLRMTLGERATAASALDLPSRLTTLAGDLRRGDGGFAKTARSGPSSTYMTYLLGGALQAAGLLDLRDSGPPLLRLIAARQRDDGGFVELEALRQSGVNPTAAALGALSMFDGFSDESSRERAWAAARYLVALQNTEGGLRANARVPAADLLSTFTTLVALTEVVELPGPTGIALPDLPQVERFARTMLTESGGFRGGNWDDAADAEYTFYGLGAMGLARRLHSDAAPRAG